jgi:hypothetical protein
VATRVFAFQQPNPEHAVVVPAGVEVDLGSPVRRRLRYAWPFVLWRLIRAPRRAHVLVSGSELRIALFFGSVAARIAPGPSRCWCTPARVMRWQTGH